MELIILGLAFLLAITIHEFSHAWTADRLGDPTARVQGRLTLNPAAHIDAVGTILVPLFLILTRSPIVFGWAKPVQFDPFNLANPRRDAALISFAGPASNLVLALILSVLLRLSLFYNVAPVLTSSVIGAFVAINVILAVFNLIPVHPLDGGKILIGLLPRETAYDWDRILHQYGIIILLLLVFPIFGGASLVTSVIGPIVTAILHLLLPFSTLI